MNLNLSRVKPGEVITADHWNLIFEALEKLGIDVGGGSGLAISGHSIYSTQSELWWLKLTASLGSGYYTWRHVTRLSGAWVECAESGGVSSAPVDDPAIEATGNAGLTPFPYYVRAWREDSGELIFSASTC